MKRTLCLLLAVMFLFLSAMPASAAAEEDVMPLWDNISTIYARITIDDTLGIVTCFGKITAYDTDPVSVVVSLQQKVDGKWVTLKSWTNSDTWTVSCSKSYAVYKGYTYRVYVTGYVYDSDGNIIESGSTFQSKDWPT